MGLPPCDEYILRMLIGQGPNRATPNRPKSNVQPFRSKRLHKSLKFRAEQPNFRSKLFSELLLRLKQPSKPYRRCIAFIIRLIDVFADKAMLYSGNLLLGCLPTADQQLFDGGWSNFFVDCAAFLPCCQIGDTHYLEQRLRLVRESGEPIFPHEHIDVCGQFAEQVVDSGEDFAMAGFAVSRVQVAQALNLGVSVFIPLNGKARTAQRQIGCQNPQRIRRSRQFGLAHDRPRRRTLRAEWRAPDDRRWYRRRDRRRGAGWHGSRAHRRGFFCNCDPATFHHISPHRISQPLPWRKWHVVEESGMHTAWRTACRRARSFRSAHRAERPES